MEDLKLANRKYEEELSRVLDHLVPEKITIITKKEKRPWFEEDLANLSRLLRRSEKIWLRIGSDDSWSAYKQIRKHYKSKLMGKNKKK